ncbi:glycosyltransferase [Salinigranum halophilum]|jgi:glycosyltransferase involved in cell wall biosynthesis|uniref:glycosyltransferase n=1 Tax=Salinigranum halophilum TaxID=2565931 RepID=UPI00115D1B71|nr:glycosyltransferase [Salinigranum halophilum]
MDGASVVAFTDTYLPTVNGVTYTIKTWRERWERRGGRMDVVFPETTDHDPDRGEYPVRSIAFPFYDGFRVAAPRVPRRVRRGDVDVVHSHTPFSLGLAGLRLASRRDVPFVASYHTPTAEYADYLTSNARLENGIEQLSTRYERWFLSHAAAVIVPSDETRDRLARVGVESDISVVQNGVDIEQFAPVDATAFRERHGLDGDTLVGYTGRHGFEKRLPDIVRAADGLDDVTVVFGGDGPARESVERLAARHDIDARFFGFLPREALPAFYSALDVFAFPSPVETQGLVALEAIACGTPVVGVREGALRDTIDDGVTGYHYEPGDIDGFRDGIRRALDEYDTLRENCLARREPISVERAVDDLEAVYDRVRQVASPRV